MSASPPSFPTRRSRLARDGIVLVVLLAWVAAMYAVRREGRAQALTGEATDVAVFSDAFEPNLRMLVTLKALGGELKGEAFRRTQEPWDGRAVVRETAAVSGIIMGAPVALERHIETHWDRGAGGFRRSDERWRVSIPGLAEQVIHATATRSRDPRTGDTVIVKLKAPGEDRESLRAFRIPKGTDLSAGLMSPARVRPVRVGVRWETQTVDPFSSEITVARVEVVAKEKVRVAGEDMTAYRALTRVEKETGMSVEVATTWYGAAGHALAQTLRLFGAELRLERAERLAASDEMFERMEGFGRQRTDGRGRAGASPEGDSDE